MSKTSIGIGVAAAGAIAFVIAVVKLYVIGYYPDELVPFLLLGAAGAAAAVIGNRVYMRARQDA